MSGGEVDNKKETIIHTEFLTEDELSKNINALKEMKSSTYINNTNKQNNSAANQIKAEILECINIDTATTRKKAVELITNLTKYAQDSNNGYELLEHIFRPAQDLLKQDSIEQPDKMLSIPEIPSPYHSMDVKNALSGQALPIIKIYYNHFQISNMILQDTNTQFFKFNNIQPLYITLQETSPQVKLSDLLSYLQKVHFIFERIINQEKTIPGIVKECIAFHHDIDKEQTKSYYSNDGSNTLLENFCDLSLPDDGIILLGSCRGEVPGFDMS